MRWEWDLSDAIHERLYHKIDLMKMYANARTSMNPPMPRIPMFFPDDQQALAWLLGALGSPEPAEQRVAWIRNTLNLNRIAVSELLAQEAAAFPAGGFFRSLSRPVSTAAGDLSPRQVCAKHAAAAYVRQFHLLTPAKGASK